MRSVVNIYRAFIFLSMVAAVAWANAESPERVIEIKDFQFAPEKIKIAQGTRVTWVNKDDSRHVIVDKNAKFRSSGLDANNKYSYTFKEAGTFTYFCAIHPAMVGTITVTATPQ